MAMIFSPRQTATLCCLTMIILLLVLLYVDSNDPARIKKITEYRKNEVDTLSNSEVMDSNEAWGLLMNYISTIKYNCKDNRRMGQVNDGGWDVCMDVNIDPNNCIAYSVGVGHDWSFDDDMSKYGCNVYTFDPTIGKDDHKHAEKVWFYNMGLWNEDLDDMKVKNDQTWKCRTLKSIISMLHHENSVIDVLKIDIEASEFKVFPEILQSGVIKQVKQVVFEYHLWGLPRGANSDKTQYAYEVLTKMLGAEGFKLFYIHENERSPVVSFGNKASDHSTNIEIGWVNTNFV